MMEERRLAKENIQNITIYIKTYVAKNIWLIKQYREVKELYVNNVCNTMPSTSINS